MSGVNRLGKEKSPYLLQHKDNPVWWYPWGQEAFDAARAENKPIFLSVGYATCHWCHVMERESFEVPEVAALLNKYFICIKVDREEHPDVDQIYMGAVQAMGQRGGWPMSVVLTPDLKPFFGGTYFPKEHFLYIMEHLGKAWTDDSSPAVAVSENLFQHLQRFSDSAGGRARGQGGGRADEKGGGRADEKGGGRADEKGGGQADGHGEGQAGGNEGGPAGLNDELLERVFQLARENFDPEHGGFGGAPKFPPSVLLALLLRIYRRRGAAEALEMVETTLDRMARGGIYDHLGGGFARYSTDAGWVVPHFEKMLYDNALLVSTYLEAYQVTGKEQYASVAKETLDYVLRDMTSAEGGFYSAEDADSEGEEGRYYIWYRPELEKELAEETLELFGDVYGVTGSGNFEGANILTHSRRYPWSVRDEPLLKRARQTLLEARERRIHPLKDDKQLTSWNGLMIAAMARGYQVLGEPQYLEAAQGAARFVQKSLCRDGTLLRRYRDGDARYEGTLEDYAYMIQALITLYESDFDPAWIEWADRLRKVQDERFWDEKGGGYFYASSESQGLIIRTRDYADSALPAPNACAALNLLRLSILFHDEGLRQQAARIMEAAGEVMVQRPDLFSQMLIALDFYLDEVREIVVVSPDDRDSASVRAFLEPLRTRFVPNKVVAFRSESVAPRLPVLEGKLPMDGKTCVYVCAGRTCLPPTTTLKDALEYADIQ